MKRSAAALAIAIALLCIWQAFLSPQAVRLESFNGGLKPAPLRWPLVPAVLAGVTAFALLADFVLLAALCAFFILLVSLITFFGTGLLVLAPSAALVGLIALHSRHSRPRL
jgi:hypothetical protein